MSTQGEKMHRYSEPLARIPFELNFNHVCVVARISESEPLCLRLDTGAQLSILDMEAARDIGLPLQTSEMQTAGVGSASLQIATAQDVTLRIEGVEVLFPQLLVASIGADLLSAYTGKATHGILGFDFICRYVIELDYVAKTMSLYDPATYQYSGPGINIPLVLQNNHPHLRAEIVMPGNHTHPVDLIVDTGGTPALVLATPFVDAHSLLDSTIQTLPTLLAGAGGMAPAVGGLIPQLRIGDITIEKPFAYFSRSKDDAISDLLGADGILGGEVFRRYKVVVDYTHQQLVLEPNEHCGEPDPYDLSGIFMKAEGKDLKTVRIEGLAPGTVAEAAALRVGDEIVSIDGTPAARFALEEIYLMFTREQDYSLLIGRDGQRFEKVLKLRKSLG